MTAESKPRIKITYATLRADNEELHSAFEAAAEHTRATLGQGYRNFIDGQWRDGDGTFEARSPIDRNILLGTFATGFVIRISQLVGLRRHRKVADRLMAALNQMPRASLQGTRAPVVVGTYDSR